MNRSTWPSAPHERGGSPSETLYAGAMKIRSATVTAVLAATLVAPAASHGDTTDPVLPTVPGHHARTTGALGSLQVRGKALIPVEQTSRYTVVMKMKRTLRGAELTCHECDRHKTDPRTGKNYHRPSGVFWNDWRAKVLKAGHTYTTTMFVTPSSSFITPTHAFVQLDFYLSNLRDPNPYLSQTSYVNLSPKAP